MTSAMLAALPPETHRAYLDAFTQGMSSLFVVAAVVGAAGFLVAWLLPDRPLRETVAAAASSVRQEAGAPFSMPPDGDPADELLRGLGILANRDVQRSYVEGIVRRAGLDLSPAAAWLLLRLQDEPELDVDALARRAGLPEERLNAGMSQLRERGYIVETPSAGSRAVARTLTPAGCDVHDRLAAARRERLVELRRQWPPEQREQLAEVLQRLAGELVPKRAAT
jgi:DNA-binding MarR family transcriptional regulator